MMRRVLTSMPAIGLVLVELFRWELSPFFYWLEAPLLLSAVLVIILSVVGMVCRLSAAANRNVQARFVTMAVL